MVAKTGDVMVWHWAHSARNPRCTAAREGPWHLLWKYLAAPGTQERKVGDRRADVLAPGGFAVEFQASPLSPGEVWSRELDWKMQLVWIFDARAAFDAGRLRVRRSAGQDADRLGGFADERRLAGRVAAKRYAWDLSWLRAPERVKSARCRSILDLGGDLIYVGEWDLRCGPLRGYGWPVTREWVAVNVLNGHVIPEPPTGRFRQESVAAKAARDFAALPYRQHWPGPADRARCRPPPLPERGWSGQALCIECGRLTGRCDAGGIPRCHGSEQSSRR